MLNLIPFFLLFSISLVTQSVAAAAGVTPPPNPDDPLPSPAGGVSEAAAEPQVLNDPSVGSCTLCFCFYNDYLRLLISAS